MDLSIAEKFLILAHHPEKGRFVITGDELDYGLAGAFLLEMANQGKITIENRRLKLKNEKNSTDKITFEISELLKSSGKDRKITYWINRLETRSGKYVHEVMGIMEGKKLVRKENRRFLGFIPYINYYLIETGTRNRLIKELRECILFDRDINNDNLAMLGLIEACEMHSIISSERDERKTIRKRLRTILKESAVSEPAGMIIKEIRSAIVNAATDTTMITTSANNC